MIRKILIAVALVLAAVHGSFAQEPEITTGSMLAEMVSMERLARAFPEGTRMVQFSSYDRFTRIKDGDTLGWWANGDLGHYLRGESNQGRVEYVMAEAEGPGAIVRLWSANPSSRVFRIYLDGASEPLIEARGKDLLGGRVEPWGPAFSGRRNLGANFIFPIPFSRSCKVTVSHRGGQTGKNPPMMYYHVGLMLYPPGSSVRSLTRAELDSLGPEIARVAGILESPDSGGEPAGRRLEAEVSLAPGAQGELFRLDGPAAVVRFELEVGAGRDALPEVLGRTLLTMSWDDEDEPGVEAPLGDFFGTSPGANLMVSLPSSVEPTAEGARLICRWVMPFSERAIIGLANQGSRRLTLRAAVIVAPWEWGPDSLYFHAGFREFIDVPTRPYRDLPMLRARGRGHFVGLEMNVRNPLEYFWWGEGDEKVWVDEEGFPSIFGTGTEDYFGYAWCVQYFKFTHAFHGVSLPTREWLFIPQFLGIPYLWEALSSRSGRRAVVSQYRWQILDPIPFERSLDIYMELMHHRETTVDVNATAFWYAASDSDDDATRPELGGRQVWLP